MRSVPALIIVIVGIVAIIAVVAFVIASIMHNYSEIEVQTEQQINESKTIPDLSQNMYVLQLFSSKNYSNIEHLKQKLEKAGYNTIVTKTMQDNEILYRLRLEGLYGKNEALALGDEIKQKFPSIQNYWLDQIGTEESVSEHIAEQNILDEGQPPETKTELPFHQQINQPQTSESGKQYEVQLMASSNYAKIEETKAALARLGYETKILNLQEGNKIVYRLRLKDLYSENRGKEIGNQIIKESPLITSYWLDEIKDGKSVPNQIQISNTTQTEKKQTQTYSGAQIYEVQLMANTDLKFVEKRKQELEKKGYRAKILTVVIKGTTYYRLRLSDAYTKEQAEEIGKKVKRDFDFVSDYWVVKKSATDKIYNPSANSRKTVQIEQPKPTQTESSPIEESVVKNNNSKSKIVDYSATCNSNDVNIRTGPGLEYEIDPIGKLMQGITVFVVEEKGDWVRFTITPNDESWSGWVRSRYLDKN